MRARLGRLGVVSVVAAAVAVGGATAAWGVARLAAPAAARPQAAAHGPSAGHRTGSAAATSAGTHRPGATLGARSSSADRTHRPGTAKLERWLNGVACSSSKSCVAVGGDAGAKVALSEVWNGRSWSKAPSVKGDALAGASCVSPTFCAAVGNSFLFGFARGTLQARSYLATHPDGSLPAPSAYLWNGHKWTSVKLPVPAKPKPALYELNQVSCASKSFCLAVGSSLTLSGSGAFVVRFDGKHWVDVPFKSTSQPSGVACPSTTECMVVGSTFAGGTFAATFNLKKWTLQQSPKAPKGGYSDFQGVSCPSTKRCLATGSEGSSSTGSHTLIAEWNGRAFSVISSATGRYWVGISCHTTTSCVAAGSAANLPAIAQWNGHKWKAVPVAKPAGYLFSGFEGVACPSSTVCVAAGFGYTASTENTLVEVWNGKAWKLEKLA